MKTIKLRFFRVSLTILLAVIAIPASSQDNLYQSAMQKAIDKMNSSQGMEDFLNVRNQFERISHKFTGKWQPVYYTAYCDIQMIYFDTKSESNKGRLDNAKGLLEKLDTFAGADASEVANLWGYYYNAMIVYIPATSQILYGNVINSYDKAIELNPENPRPVILRAFFNQFLPSFVKLKINAATELEKAKKLFAEQERSVESPYWGEYFINQIKIEE